MSDVKEKKGGQAAEVKRLLALGDGEAELIMVMNQSGREVAVWSDTGEATKALAYEGRGEHGWQYLYGKKVPKGPTPEETAQMRADNLATKPDQLPVLLLELLKRGGNFNAPGAGK